MSGKKKKMEKIKLKLKFKRKPNVTLTMLIHTSLKIIRKLFFFNTYVFKHLNIFNVLFYYYY